MTGSDKYGATEMKRTIATAIAAVSAFLFAVSCTKQETVPQVGNSGIAGKPFTAVIEQETTRTVLTDEYKVNWESGDQISINGAVYSATPDESDATKADFTFVSGTDPEPTYKAVFPASLYNAGSYAFPATQAYSAGKLNAPMYAESETDNLSFRNICGVICLALKGTGSVRSIAVTAYEPICGAFSMTDATTVSLTGTGKTVTLECGVTGVPLNMETATRFYIYLAPGTYSAGMRFVITNTSGGIYEKTTAKDVTIERSNVYTFNWTSDFAPALSLYALPGKFSVADGRQVHFARGNLYAKKIGFGSYSFWTWGIYNNQYDSNALNYGETRTATDDDTQIDLFTWGYSATQSLLPTGDNSDNVEIENGNLPYSEDWGSMIAGTTAPWLTPTRAEWQYLFKERTNASSLYKCGVTVCGKPNCVVIAPDDWNITASPLQAEYSDTSTPMTWAEAQTAGLVCLPAAGYRTADAVSDVGIKGWYWSSTGHLYDTTTTTGYNAGSVDSSDRFINIGAPSRGQGCSVRLITRAVSFSDNNLSVDLGLSVRWAACNLGASNPWEYGGYYQWAGTEDVSDVSKLLGWENCPYYTGSGITDEYSSPILWTKYTSHMQGDNIAGDGKAVLEPADDAACVNLGEGWRMPTDAECQELIDCCTWSWTDNYNSTGTAGYIVTSNKAEYTDCSIFLPAAGQRKGNSLINKGQEGYYWPSSSYQGPWASCNAVNGLHFSDSKLLLEDSNRYLGFSVRPVLPY